MPFGDSDAPVPKQRRLMKDARRRRFDAVLVWKFDRFARSVAHLLRALEEFKSLGIEFVSLTEGVDTSTPMGKMVFTVLGAVAELERSLIVERVKAAMRNARAKGTHVGRPRMSVDIASVRARMGKGESVRSIARDLNLSAAFISKRIRGGR
jgi:DNA invertase Pin-like site-specific DNA recombinase